MRRIVPIASLLLLTAAPLASCGRDESPPPLPILHEEAAPNSPKVDQTETDAQRQQQLTDEMQKQQEKEFDSAAGAQAPAEKPSQ